MNADLQLLIELQKLDEEIAKLETEIRALPETIVRVESELSGHIQDLESQKSHLAENQRARRKRENDVALLREKLSRFKEQVFAVKTNEQYRALLHEIEYHEAQIQKIEDEILGQMIEAEALEKTLRAAEQSLAAERARAEQEISAARKEKQKDEETLGKVQAQRAQTQKQLPPDIYRLYERVAQFRRGVAVVPVHDGACGACHVRLRPQAYNEVKTNQQILSCESCARILYYLPEPATE